MAMNYEPLSLMVLGLTILAVIGTFLFGFHCGTTLFNKRKNRLWLVISVVGVVLNIVLAMQSYRYFYWRGVIDGVHAERASFPSPPTNFRDL